MARSLFAGYRLKNRAKIPQSQGICRVSCGALFRARFLFAEPPFMKVPQHDFDVGICNGLFEQFPHEEANQFQVAMSVTGSRGWKRPPRECLDRLIEHVDNEALRV